MLRNATKRDLKVLNGLNDFIVSLDLDILKKVQKKSFLKFYSIVLILMKIDLVIKIVEFMKKMIIF